MGPKVRKTAVSVLLGSPQHKINDVTSEGSSSACQFLRVSEFLRVSVPPRVRVPPCVSSPRASRLSAGVCESATARWPSLPPLRDLGTAFPIDLYLQHRSRKRWSIHLA